MWESEAPCAEEMPSDVASQPAATFTAFVTNVGNVQISTAGNELAKSQEGETDQKPKP
jgi:hypothetical protein